VVEMMKTDQAHRHHKSWSKNLDNVRVLVVAYWAGREILAAF
jgi:hypothetical protein